jgi:hypothetical protein
MNSIVLLCRILENFLKVYTCYFRGARGALFACSQDAAKSGHKNGGLLFPTLFHVFQAAKISDQQYLKYLDFSGTIIRNAPYF